MRWKSHEIQQDLSETIKKQTDC